MLDDLIRLALANAALVFGSFILLWAVSLASAIRASSTSGSPRASVQLRCSAFSWRTAPSRAAS